MDEAVLRIVVQDEGALDSDAASPDRGPPEQVPAPPPPSQSSLPPRPAAAPLPPDRRPAPQAPPAAQAAGRSFQQQSSFDPAEDARKVREAEIRREQIKLAYDKLYGTAERTNKTFDVVLGMAEKMRGTLGGVFGPLVGSILDVFAAVRDARKVRLSDSIKQEAERRNWSATQPVPSPQASAAVITPQSEAAPLPPAFRSAPPQNQAPPPTTQPEQSKAIIDEATAALVALGHSQKEADALLAKVMAAATKTFASVEEVLRAAYRKDSAAPVHKVSGGVVPEVAGVPKSADEVPIRATAGEGILTTKAMQEPGVKEFMESANAGQQRSMLDKIKGAPAKLKEWMAERYGPKTMTAAMGIGQGATWGASALLTAGLGVPAMLPPGTGILTALAAAEVMHRMQDPRKVKAERHDQRERMAIEEGRFAELPKFADSGAGHYAEGGEIPRTDTLDHKGPDFPVGTKRRGGEGYVDELMELPIASLPVTEGNKMYAAKIQHYVDNPSIRRPLVFLEDGEYRVDDGNHRIAADEERGLKASKVWVRKIDKDVPHYVTGTPPGGVPPMPGVHPQSDGIPASLTAGEAVVTKHAYAKPDNRAAVDAMNRDEPIKKSFGDSGPWALESTQQKVLSSLTQRTPGAPPVPGDNADKDAARPFGSKVGNLVDTAFSVGKKFFGGAPKAPAGEAAPAAAGAEAVAPVAAGGMDVMAALEMAQPEIAVAMLALQVVKQVGEVATTAVRAVGSLAAMSADPDANPAKVISTIGETTKGVSDKIFYISPALGLLGSVAGETASSLGKLMDTINARAAQLGEFSAPIAMAQAQNEMRQTFGEFRRAQEAGPELARYLHMQGDLQQKFEDIKIKVLLKILPIVTLIGSAVEAIMPTGQGIEAAINVLAGPLAQLASYAAQLVNIQGDAANPAPGDPTDILFQNFVPPAPGTPQQGVQVPQL